MADIVLTTLNAKYSHASFGLRYLIANLGDLKPQATMLEFDINQRPTDIAEIILSKNPKIVGIGVYIWNVTEATEVVSLLRKIRPDLTIIVGGPEVSYEVEEQTICQTADYVITGEADFKFADVCRQLLRGEKPPQKIVYAEPVDVRNLASPYEFYDNKDIAHRVIYVEASRGCPFTCEFCLSSLDLPLRRFPLETLLPEFQKLLDRGVRVFKFVDRTFNLSIAYSMKLLEFFLERYEPGLFLHFEMIPDRLPEELRQIILAFPQGAMQFEVGIQTFNETVAELIKRRQDYAKTEENIRWLLKHTGAYIHSDLIFGLPGEDIESFGSGFDRLVALKPQEIQVNILKRLRGTPIVRHDREWAMNYNPHPPYEILQNKLIDYATMQRLRRFGRYWDLFSNSGHFVETLPLLWLDASPFQRFMAFSEWLYEQGGRTHSLALDYLAEQLHIFLTQKLDTPLSLISETILRDYQRGARRETPKFLKEQLAITDPKREKRSAKLLKRQARRMIAS